MREKKRSEVKVMFQWLTFCDLLFAFRYKSFPELLKNLPRNNNTLVYFWSCLVYSSVWFIFKNIGQILKKKACLRYAMSNRRMSSMKKVHISGLLWIHNQREHLNFLFEIVGQDDPKEDTCALKIYLPYGSHPQWSFVIHILFWVIINN